MSLDDRCQQFHDAALGTGKSKGTIKEITTLRNFLHKNQNQRFTDRGVSRLFDTIQLYLNKDDVENEIKEGLLEDSLKLPFTVFSTKQKKTMIKWLQELRGIDNEKGRRRSTEGDSSTKSSSSASCILSVIDVENNKLTLMLEDTGDTYDDISLPKGELGVTIQQAFEKTDGVISIEAQMVDGTVQSIRRLVDDSS
jgi:hypothetical protein